MSARARTARAVPPPPAAAVPPPPSAPGVAGPHQRRHRLAALALVAVVAFAVYSRTLPYQLVSDDPHLRSYVQALHEQGGVWKILTAEFRLQSGEEKTLGYYRPVVLLSIWADSLLAPFFPSIFHLTNLLLHAAVTALVFLLLRLLFGSVGAATCGALLFAVHPAHTESVAFVSGRTDLWATLFAVLATLAWAAARAPARRQDVAGLKLLGGVATLLATLSKEAAFLLPAVLLAWDAVATDLDPRPLSGWWRRNRGWLPVWGAALAAAVALRFGAAGVGFGAGGPAVATTHPGLTAQAVAHVPRIFANYLGLLVIPWPLSNYYTPDQVNFGVRAVAGTLLFLGFCAAAASTAAGRIGGVALLWTLGFLLPVSGIVPLKGSLLAERFLYLPSLGLCLLAAYWFKRAAAGPRRLVTLAAAAILLAVMATGAALRAGVFRDPRAMYKDLTQTSPLFLTGHYNLGIVSLDLDRFEEALAAFQTATYLWPFDEGSLQGLGTAYAYLGRYPEALDAFRRALSRRPDPLLGHYAAGVEAALQGRHQEAVAHYRALADANMADAFIFFSLAESREGLGQWGEAAAAYRRAIQDKPGWALPHFRLGRALLRQGDFAGARLEYEALVRMSPPLAGQLGEALRAARAGNPG